MTTREFEICFRRLYMPLGMYALRLVDDADVAEDLVQDAFMKAWIREIPTIKYLKRLQIFWLNKSMPKT